MKHGTPDGTDVEPLDLIILGGGPAGMAAALVAGRARLRTIVINAENPRNAVTRASHGFLTRDGIHPTELLAIAKTQLAKYPSVEYVLGTATDVVADPKGFMVEQHGGRSWVTRRVLIATGYRDDLSLLSLPGIEAVYGKSVYPCPFCDGFEHADERIAVFAGESASGFVPVVRVWSDDVVVFTNGRELAPEAKETLRGHGVQVEEARVTRLVSEDGKLQAIELEGGTSVDRDVGFIGDDFSVPATEFAGQLGVPRIRNMWGMEVFEADDAGKTSVAGLYLVGDARSGFGGLTAAAHDGSNCAEHIVHEIAMERWGRREVSG